MVPEVRDAIRAEIEADPMGRGYAGATAAEQAALLNAGFEVPAAPGRRNVPISDVRGYLEARLVLVRLEDWWPGAAPGDARDAARTLLRVTSAPGLTEFLTASDAGRANVLGLFALLVAAGAGGLTPTHYVEIEAMTVAPAGPPAQHHSRWLSLMLALSPEAAEGLPNEVTAAMIDEALA